MKWTAGTLHFHARPGSHPENPPPLGVRVGRPSRLARLPRAGTAEVPRNRSRPTILFLVGDIVDFWSLRRSFYWPEAHNEVLRAILAMAKEGTRVIYVPGNHDDNIREFCGSMFGNVSIRRRYVHSTADGREFLVMHGDEFDSAVKCSRWLASFGATAYEIMMRINRGVNLCRRALGLPHWSLATYLKLRLRECRALRRGIRTCRGASRAEPQLSGIVCGHIHRPGLREIDGVLYCNDGDWVESCTAARRAHERRACALACGKSVRAPRAGDPGRDRGIGFSYTVRITRVSPRLLAGAL